MPRHPRPDPLSAAEAALCRRPVHRHTGTYYDAMAFDSFLRQCEPVEVDVGGKRWVQTPYPLGCNRCLELGGHCVIPAESTARKGVTAARKAGSCLVCRRGAFRCQFAHLPQVDVPTRSDEVKMRHYGRVKRARRLAMLQELRERVIADRDHGAERDDAERDDAERDNAEEENGGEKEEAAEKAMGLNRLSQEDKDEEVERLGHKDKGSNDDRDGSNKMLQLAVVEREMRAEAAESAYVALEVRSATRIKDLEGRIAFLEGQLRGVRAAIACPQGY